MDKTVAYHRFFSATTEGRTFRLKVSAGIAALAVLCGLIAVWVWALLDPSPKVIAAWAITGGLVATLSLVVCLTGVDW